jgi:hypothetical protein
MSQHNNRLGGKHLSSALMAAAFLVALCLGYAPAWGQHHIDWQVVASSGPPQSQSSGAHKLFSVTGQPSPVDEASSEAHRIRSGYMQAFDASCCLTPGDANSDTNVNVGDVVFLINMVFKGGPAPACPNQGDANHDCNLNIGDAVFLINLVFKGGAAPQCGCVTP